MARTRRRAGCRLTWPTQRLRAEVWPRRAGGRCRPGRAAARHFNAQAIGPVAKRRPEHAAGGEHTGDEDSENRSSKGEDVNEGEDEGVGSEDEGDQEPGGTRSGGLLITAADVTQDPTDQAQLLPMIEAAEQSGGPAAGLTLADAGYFSAANLAACAARATPVAIPEARCRAQPYHHSSPTTPAPTATRSRRPAAAPSRPGLKPAPAILCG